MSLASVSRMEAKLLVPTYERQPILFVRGQGVYLWDSEGKRYLDFLSGIGVNALGHNHPAVQSVIRKQASRLIHISNLFFHEYQAELAQMLTQISGLGKVRSKSPVPSLRRSSRRITKTAASQNRRFASWRWIILFTDAPSVRWLRPVSRNIVLRLFHCCPA
jgi:hypothetical protein